METFEEMIIRLNQTKNLLQFQKEYIDVCEGDIETAVLLWYITSVYVVTKYPTLVSTSTVYEGVFVDNLGKVWIGKTPTLWWSEVRLNPSQLERTSNKLRDIDLIDKLLEPRTGLLYIRLKPLSLLFQMRRILLFG
jgi:hypothetical protein